MTTKIYFIFILFLLQAKVFAGACEDEFNQSAKTPPIPTDSAALVSVNGVSVDFLFDLRLDSLNFNTRLQNVFQEMDFTYIGDIILYSERDFLSLDNFGRGSLNELTARLSGLGLHLEMDIGDWKPLVLERKIGITENLSKSGIEEAVSEPKKMGSNTANTSTNVNKIHSSGVDRSSLNPDFQREMTSISESHLIQIRGSVFLTPEFNRWFDKKNKLHPNSKMKVMNITERFEMEGIDGLGSRWSHLGGGVFKLLIASGSRGELRIYFTVKSDKLVFLFGEKASDSVGVKTRNNSKARQLIEKYFSL